MFVFFFFSSIRRHTRCALVTGVQTCALPIYLGLLQRSYGEETEAVRVGAAMSRDRLSRPIASIFDGGLHEFITDFLRANAALARQIERDYRLDRKSVV